MNGLASAFACEKCFAWHVSCHSDTVYRTIAVCFLFYRQQILPWESFERCEHKGSSWTKDLNWTHARRTFLNDRCSAISNLSVFVTSVDEFVNIHAIWFRWLQCIIGCFESLRDCNDTRADPGQSVLMRRLIQIYACRKCLRSSFLVATLKSNNKLF